MVSAPDPRPLSTSRHQGVNLHEGYALPAAGQQRLPSPTTARKVVLPVVLRARPVVLPMKKPGEGASSTGWIR
jgi:hypothetical protein